MNTIMGDQEEPSTRPANALSSSDVGILSKMSFAWAYPTLELGSKRPLEECDLPDLHIFESSDFNRTKIEEMWNAEKKTGRNNLGRALFAEYLRSTWRAQLLALVNMIARIGQAWALGMLMEQFGKFEVDADADAGVGSIDTKKGYLYAGLLVACGLIAFPTKQQQFFQAYRKGMQLRVGMIAAIYQKALRLPAAGIGGDNNVTAGHVTNLASNDVERFVSTSVTTTFLLVGPMISIIILLMGIFIIGPVFAAGYGLLFLLVPLQMFAGRRFAYFRSKVAKLTDDRVSLISQAVNGARVMKFNGWENSFNERISSIRKHEIVLLQRASVFKASNEALFYFTSLAVSVFIFTIHVSLGGILTPKNVFTTMTLLNIVQFILTKHVPNAVMGLSECYISCKRIQAFFELSEWEHLSQEDQVNESIKDSAEKHADSGQVLSFSNVTCHWKEPSQESDLLPGLGRIALSDISISFQTGKLYCIIGIVGSGKSALLQALAGELPVSEGKVMRNYTTLSYAVQDPWIMDASVRENIVMGCPFDEDWYNEVVKACGLEADIAGFLFGDMTILGDRGVQCSGGQQARIGLARAIYCDSEVLLLDDCLSAVDSKIAHILFYSAIQQLVLKRGCCVILVTHQLQFAGDADYCVFVDNGKLLGKGSFSDCVSISNGKLTNTLQTEKVETQKKPMIESDERLPSITTLIPPSGDQGETEVVEDDAQREKRTTGIIHPTTWKAYGKALGGTMTCFLFFASFAITQVSQLVAIIQIGNWSGSASDQQSSYIGLVSWLTCIVILLSIARAYFTFYFLIKASQRLHHQMLQSVLRAKIEFFDTNPLGRILNRFSADVGICDETLPLTIYDFAVGVFVVVGSVVIAIVSLPFTLIALPPLVYYFIQLRRVFVMTTRELKRLEGMARSPIYAMMSEALKGIATIRSNNKMQYFSDKFEEVQNAHSRAFFSFTASSRWFAFKLDCLSFILMAVASVFAVLFHDQGWFQVDPSILGLSLTLLIQISTTNFPWVVRQSAEVTNQVSTFSAKIHLSFYQKIPSDSISGCTQMVSVERIIEFGNLSPEAPLEADRDRDFKPDKDTSIKVKNLTTRYRSNLPVCLDGVSFQIEAGQRVGVVGRTGSGKSSLVQALFRILEAETGSIEINGIDISSIGLHKLRTSMAVIPQFPVLFSGCTIRENLDPFSKYSENNIREALEAVQMIDVIDALPGRLNASVADGGANFSVGQRQLLCLTRAVLLHNQIIVLDEPTANVDSNTDRLLQKTLRERFSGATIISIAHRLDTIIDYDRILVLGEGKVLEFGTPSELLSKDEGHFLSMVKSTGDAMAELLFSRAKRMK